MSDELNNFHLSATSVNRYIECGLQYKFAKVDNYKPDYVADALLFGAMIHKTIADFNTDKMFGMHWTKKKLSDIWKKHWSSIKNGKVGDIKWKKDWTYERYLEYGELLFDIFWEHNAKEMEDRPKRKIIGVEKFFEFNIANDQPIPVIGYIDLIEKDYDEDGKDYIIISDYKTLGQKMSQIKLLKDFQITLYYMALKNGKITDLKGYEIEPIDVLKMGKTKVQATLDKNEKIIEKFKTMKYELKFDCLIKTKKPKYLVEKVEREDRHINHAIRKMRQVYSGIDKGVFIPNETSWKCPCEYGTKCAEWFEGSCVDRSL